MHAEQPPSSPGQVLIGQRVFAAVEASFEAAPVGELELKGLKFCVARSELPSRGSSVSGGDEH